MNKIQKQLKENIQTILKEFKELESPRICLDEMIKESIQDHLYSEDEEYNWKDEYIDLFVETNLYEVLDLIYSWEEDLEELKEDNESYIKN